MEPVSVSANSAAMAKVRIKMIMTAPALLDGTLGTKEPPLVSDS